MPIDEWFLICCLPGDVYYRYSVPNHAVDPGYPSSLSSWNIPGNQVSAAAQWTNSRSYFFTSNGEYYRYNDGQSNVDAGYPLDTAPNWQKCSCSGKVDAVTLTQDGSTYIFERELPEARCQLTIDIIV